MFRFRRALKHHLFLLAHPDSSAKSGKIEPADVSHIVKQCQLLPLHSPEILYRPAKDVLSERRRLRLVKATHFAWDTYWLMCKSCITYSLNYILYVCILQELSHSKSSKIQFRITNLLKKLPMDTDDLSHHGQAL